MLHVNGCLLRAIGCPLQVVSKPAVHLLLSHSPVLDLALHRRRLQQLVRRRKLAAADLSVQHNRRRAYTRRSFPRLNKRKVSGTVCTVRLQR